MNTKNRIKTLAFKTLPSTNEYAKTLRGRGDSLFITAKRQTAGRGTKGRSFSSESGGIYLTYLHCLQGVSSSRSFSLMAGAAVAVCKTLEACGLRPVIKWANDVHVNGKKICGILTENTFSGECISSSIIGIGINVNNLLPAELGEIATTLRVETGKKWSVKKLTKRLTAHLLEENGVEEYLARIGYMGRSAQLLVGEERIPVTLLSVDAEGGLTVETDGERKRFVAAEVSLRV